MGREGEGRVRCKVRMRGKDVEEERMVRKGRWKVEGRNEIRVRRGKGGK